MTLPRVVIVGGGFAGLEAARALAGAPVRVTVLDRHNYHLFQPLLYQVATASLSPGDVASPIRWILRRQQNVEVLLANVIGIDPIDKRIEIEPARSPPMSYDYLIVGAGATHAYFGHPEWADRAPGLKTLDDALDMRRRVLLAFEAAERESDAVQQRRLLTFIIVGGGPTGVELAGALAEIARQSLRHDFRHIRPESARIVLVEGGPDVLPAFPPPLRVAAKDALEQLGVEVRTGWMVTGVDADGVSWKQREGPIERLDAGTILWAAGVAASPIAKSLGVPLDRVGRVPAEPTLQVPGRPEIFVAGDICALSQDGVPLPGVAQVAMQEGAHASRNVLRAIGGQPLTPFRYKDYGTMATIGRGSAVGEVYGMKVSGFVAWLFWIFLHIFWLIGFRNRIAVMTEWAWAYLTFQRRVRLITGEKL
ncbi:MAG TPA: NAD(P)/FAD-dependent oxidoreductase [Vicinamibacterales bacterium]|nr:NAD(P)/FAD-dependent oxidoreductase [Vicinamibacterales bacterium]